MRSLPPVPPRRSLAIKLSVAFLFVSVIGVGIAAAVVHFATQRDVDQAALLRAHDQFLAQVTGYYTQHHSWAGIAQQFQVGPPPGPGAGGQPPPPSAPPPPPQFGLADSAGVVVVPDPRHPPGTMVPASTLAAGTPVHVDGVVVGTVLPLVGRPALSDAEQRFLASTNDALLAGVVVAAVIALALSVVLARALTRPVREMTQAFRAMAAGQLMQRVSVRSRDELGTLTLAFNQLSADLERATAQRRQMTADIAHDLRTPLTAIAGYLEALRDGVLAPSHERFTMMHDEAQRLLRLIEDLRTLSLADSSELRIATEAVEPRALLEGVAASFALAAEQRGVALVVEAPEDLPTIAGDAARLAQVCGNLVANALRFTPPGGRVTLLAEGGPGEVTLRIRDTGSGISASLLPHIFDRAYRADPARSQQDGGSGLGLAIARALVEAHGGTLGVASAEGAGTVFSIALPATPAVVAATAGE
jgi:signal transduction histidine kinase